MIKRSPIVLMWKFAAIEAAAVLLYFALALLGNAKYDLYTQLSFSSLLSYQAAKMLFLAGAQFGLTVYAFLSWYYEYYTVNHNSIAHAYGIFFKKEMVFAIHNSATFAIYSNPLGKLLHYGHHFHPQQLNKEQSFDINGNLFTIYSR